MTEESLYHVFCCDQFEVTVLRMGEAGFSFVLRQSVNALFFTLQSRGCDEGDIEELTAKATKDMPAIRIVEQQTIHFCPFCGMKLSIWIDSHKSISQDLLVKSKPFLMQS